MREIKLRILDTKKHNELKEAYDCDVRDENNLYVVFYSLTSIQESAIEHAIDKGVYRLCGDEEYDFVDVNTNSRHEYKNFEEYYEDHKAEYMAGDNAEKREHKRIHEGLHDIIHFISRHFKCNNVTATTTMLLQFGTYEFYNKISQEDFEVINNAYFSSATSAMQYKRYFDGAVTKMLLSRPALAYANSRAVILDVNRRDKQVTFYQTDFVFKTLENLHRIGFEGTYAKFGYELLIALALDNSEVIHEMGLKQNIFKLSSPTIDEIKEVIQSNLIK